MQTFGDFPGHGGLTGSQNAPSERYSIVACALLTAVSSTVVLALTRSHPGYLVWRVSVGYTLAVVGAILAMWAFADDVRRSGHPDYRRRLRFGVDQIAAAIRLLSFALGLIHTGMAAWDAAR